MNRLITGRLGIFSFFVALFAAGCAYEQANESAEQQQDIEDSEMISAGSPRTPTGMNGTPVVVHSGSGSRSETGICLGCGPLPDPWKMGPLPDPWTSSSGGSNGGGVSSSSGGVSSSGGTSGSSGDGKH